LALLSTPTQATAEPHASTKLPGRDEVRPGYERPEIMRDIFHGFGRMRDFALEARIPITLRVLVIQAELEPSAKNSPPRVRGPKQGLARSESCYFTSARHELLNAAIRGDVQRDVLEWLGKTV
jgi:hypothetical protein